VNSFDSADKLAGFAVKAIRRRNDDIEREGIKERGGNKGCSPMNPPR
jgi:hypothetical protein